MSMAVRRVILNDVPEAANAVSYDETRAALNQFPPDVATLIADLAMQRFESIIFGPEQWKTHWGATPVTASGEEEHPALPIELYRCLNNQVRPGEREKLAGLTCAVTYIPEYVRKDDKVMAVTSRTLAVDLAPKPLLGHPAGVFELRDKLKHVFNEKEADGTEPSGYFVMQLDIEPATQGKKGSEATQFVTQGGWTAPEIRNCLATVFSRRAWKGDLLYGTTMMSTFCKRAGKDFLLCGAFLDCGPPHGALIIILDVPGDRPLLKVEGASASRKFQPLTLK